MRAFSNDKTFGKVAVLLGGDSAEREVSLASGNAVLKALRKRGIDAHPFDPSMRSIYELVTDGFDQAFNILHGRGGEDGVVQGALEQLKIPYTGTGVLGSALAMDKVLSKLVWSARELPTADYRVLTQSDFNPQEAEHIVKDLGGKTIVKPSREGSSVGMSIADNAESLIQAVEAAFAYDQDVLVESYIEGAEYTVAILNGQAMPSIRMTTHHAFYDYDAKYKSNDTQYFCPSGLSLVEEQSLARLALTAFEMLSGYGWGRVDLMRDKQGKFYLLESNTVPGMTAKSLVPKAAMQAGIAFEELCLKILAQTLRQADV